MESTRETYQQRMEAQLKEWGARLEVVKARADKAGADARIELQKQLAELKELEGSARRHYEDLKASSADRWQDAKRDVEQRWDAVCGTMDALWNKVKPGD